jgi:Uma2 family endonuclease
MTVSLAQPQEIIHLSGISWQTYERLLEELSDRRLRLTYNRGYLEIMAPSYEHENYKEVLGDFVTPFPAEDYVFPSPRASRASRASRAFSSRYFLSGKGVRL